MYKLLNDNGTIIFKEPTRKMYEKISYDQFMMNIFICFQLHQLKNYTKILIYIYQASKTHGDFRDI